MMSHRHDDESLISRKMQERSFLRLRCIAILGVERRWSDVIEFCIRRHIHAAMLCGKLCLIFEAK